VTETSPPAHVTITLTRYREPDWLVMETLESLARQTGVKGEVIFLDQNWREDFARDVACLSTPHLIFICEPCPEKGLSHARNRGLEAANNDLVLFIDADAVAASDWAREMAAALSQGAAVAGARILPRWRGRKPLMARARVVLDQYSLLDWGEDVIDAPRVVGAGFGLRKSAAPDLMYFDEAFGRREGKLFGGEESDLCARLRASGLRIVYCGRAVVHHQILPERLNWFWIMKRLYFAGAGRRQQGGAPAPSRKPGLWDWALLPVILPPYAAGYLLSAGARRNAATTQNECIATRTP
jgi:GT2 family glycosyltransferase